jgi:hypothetical protein
LLACVSADDGCCAHIIGGVAEGYRNEKNFQNSVIGAGIDFVDELIFSLL